MILGIALGLFVVGIAVLGLGVRGGKGARVPPADGEGTVLDPEGDPGGGAAIPWTRRVGLEPGELDDAARARAVDDLSRLGDLWAIGVLAQALEEEGDPALRGRILAGLRQAAAGIPGAQGHADACEAFERVLASSEPEDRSLAVEALGELGALGPVERALHDPCLPVAQTAALTLLGRGVREPVMRVLTDAEPERAEAIQTVLDAIE